jgi:hypothetical protein
MAENGGAKIVSFILFLCFVSFFFLSFLFLNQLTSISGTNVAAAFNYFCHIVALTLSPLPSPPPSPPHPSKCRGYKKGSVTERCGKLSWSVLSVHSFF